MEYNDTNARQEFIDAVKNYAKIKCAVIYTEKQDAKILKVGYSAKEYDEFLDKLDFEYDSGYGGQNLFGHIWLEDNTWLSRGEYDGSEWWEYNAVPEIPTECL